MFDIDTTGPVAPAIGVAAIAATNQLVMLDFTAANKLCDEHMALRLRLSSKRHSSCVRTIGADEEAGSGAEGACAVWVAVWAQHKAWMVRL